LAATGNYLERAAPLHRYPFGHEAKEDQMSELYPVYNPRPWGASLTIATIIIMAYLGLSVYMHL